MGYGDKVPITAVGRWSAVVLMVTGIGLIGALAGSLASFLRLDRSASEPDADEQSVGPPTIAEVRAQLAELDSQLAALEAEDGHAQPPGE